MEASYQDITIKELLQEDMKNILHIGGHEGGEAPYYEEIGAEFTFVEPVPEFAEKIRARGDLVIEKAVSSERGVAEYIVFDVASGFHKRNLSKAKADARITEKHGAPRTIEVETIPLIEIQKGFDTVVIDTEGHDLEVMRSGNIMDFTYIIIEIRHKPGYHGEPTREEVIQYLTARGFQQIKKAKHNRLFKNVKK